MRGIVSGIFSNFINRYYIPDHNIAFSDEFMRVDKIKFQRRMTIKGSINKTLITFIILFASAMFTWILYYDNVRLLGFVFLSVIVSFILAILILVFQKLSPYLVPFYSAFQGFVLGGISIFLSSLYGGIITQVVLITFGTFLFMLLAYKTNIIHISENVKSVIFCASGGIFFVYVIDFILQYFGLGIPFIHSTGIDGFIISIFFVLIASLNFVLDFDFIEEAVENRYPKYFEWYAAFGLMLTLVFVYIFLFYLIASRERRNRDD